MKNIQRDSRGRIPQIWSIESALEESKKFNSRKEFRTRSSSAYQLLVRKGLAHLINLPGKRHRLTNWEIFCSLKKSKSWAEFREIYPKEYTAFSKRKKSIHKSAFIHLGISQTGFKWDEESILNEAKKYNFRSEFSSMAPGAYDAAHRQGMLDKACLHMTPLQSDFDAVYIWTALIEVDRRLVKVGVTSRRLGYTRIDFVSRKSGYQAKDISILECENALTIEKTLKKIGSSADLPVFSGSSEFLWMNESEYEQALEVMRNGSKN
jgi:hypothetical protein